VKEGMGSWGHLKKFLTSTVIEPVSTWQSLLWTGLWEIILQFLDIPKNTICFIWQVEGEK
jgi:hypothetical protein